MPESNVAAQTGTPDGAPLDLAIVILNYNTCDLLRNCLHSLQAQPPGLRVGVYVVVHATVDNSAEMLLQ